MPSAMTSTTNGVNLHNGHERDSGLGISAIYHRFHGMRTPMEGYAVFYILRIEPSQKGAGSETQRTGNPAMPMKMPYGPEWFREIEWKIPNLVMANDPGFENLSAHIMKQTLTEKCLPGERSAANLYRGRRQIYRLSDDIRPFRLAKK
jgi:hypothetical protein